MKEKVLPTGFFLVSRFDVEIPHFLNQTHQKLPSTTKKTLNKLPLFLLIKSVEKSWDRDLIILANMPFKNIPT